MQLIKKISQGIHFLLCVISIFSKHAWHIPSKDNIGITITSTVQEI